jgi:hypothetical protein
VLVDARFTAAARASSADARADLLRPAVAAAPDRLDVRMALFRAELGARRFASAVEVMAPVVSRDRTLTRLDVGAAERFRLAREIAEASEGAGALEEAARFYTIAMEGQPAATLPVVRAQLEAVEAEIARRRSNADRRPQVRASLDQPARVRPLIAAAAPGAAGARP